MKSKNIQVWDLFIRLFHWTLVVAFTVSYLTEGEVYLHFYSGWYIGILLVLRIIWGGIGSAYARFSDFIQPPTEIFNYAKSLFDKTKPPRRYLGHNPLGGLMVIALLLSLSMTCVSGTLLYTENNKPMLSFIGHSPTEAFKEGDEHNDTDNSQIEQSIDGGAIEQKKEKPWWEEIHEFFANLTVILVIVHVVGVVVTSRRHGENLVLAMLTGKKACE